MPPSSSSAGYRTAVSAGILLVVGLHAMPLLHRPTMKRQWPFMAWAMYKDSRPPGPISANKRRMIGTTAGGQRLEVTARMVGLAPAAVSRMYAKPMWAGDSLTARRLVERLNRGRRDPFVEMRLEGENFLVRDDGIAEQALPPVTYRVSPPAGP